MVVYKQNGTSCNGLHQVQTRFPLISNSTSNINFVKENLDLDSTLIAQKKVSALKYNIVRSSKHKMYSLILWLQRNSKKTAKKYKVAKQKVHVPEKHAANLNLTKKVELQDTKCSSLEEVLKAKESTNTFRTFLVKEMSEENLDFYLAVESYKKQSPEVQPKLAEKIFNSFLAPNSPNEVNVDHHTRKQTKENLLSPDVTTFDLAQQQIYHLMETDSFRRFSEQFR